MEVEQKKILVTGASGGIGRAICLAAAKKGYYVIAHYNRGKEKAEETLRLIKDDGGKGELIQFDVLDRDGCKKNMEDILSVHGAPWGVISNAGINRDQTFAGLEGQDWDSVVHTSLDGFYNVLQPLTLAMCRKKKGRIIAISSVSGITGNRGQTNYSAAKAGLIGACKALAVELASRNITVNAVAPGLIETEMLKDAPVETLLASVPMKRMGKPEDVANLVTFLLSEEAGYITRQVISVNGGII